MNYKDINSNKQLANYLRCSLEFLEKAINEEYFIYENHNDISHHNDSIRVDKFHIKKKGGKHGFRTVHSVFTYQLSNSLKILNNYLNEIYVPNDCVHGFVNGKSIKTNAHLHLGKKIVLSVDIENFFETISDEMVSISLHNLGFQKEIADSIAKITTINGKLVQGFNTSPTLANIVVHEMDLKLIEFCGTNIAYTRYADDLYFSSDDILPDIGEIESIIKTFSFNLNKKKTKVMKRGQSQFVTGLTVFDDKTPRIPKRIKRNLRLEIYFIRKFGYIKHAKRRLKNKGCTLSGQELRWEIEQEIIETQHRLFGWIHYIHSIEPEISKKMYGKLYGAAKRK